MARSLHYRSLGASVLLLTLSIVLYVEISHNFGRVAVPSRLHGSLYATIALPLIHETAVPLGIHDDLKPLTDAPAVNSSEEDGLEKRAGEATLTWQEALNKGALCLARLNGPWQQSQWTTMQQLEENGWDIGDPEPDVQTNDYFGGPGGPYKTLHIRQGAGSVIEATQDESFDNCHGEDIPGTEGIYEQIYNPVGRTMVNTFNFSPLFKAKKKQDWIQHRDVPIQELAPFVPLIYKWSDVVGIIWADQARQSNVSPNSLKYLFRHNIATPDTRQIIEGAAGNRFGTKWEGVWPGKRFAKGTTQFQALLGTPHGKSITWLIVEHPNEFPKKDIESITIFTIAKGAYCMLFTLTD